MSQEARSRLNGLWTTHSARLLAELSGGSTVSPALVMAQLQDGFRRAREKAVVLTSGPDLTALVALAQAVDQIEARCKQAARLTKDQNWSVLAECYGNSSAKRVAIGIYEAEEWHLFHKLAYHLSQGMMLVTQIADHPATHISHEIQ